MKSLRNVLDKMLETLAGISFLTMVLLTCWQVVTRYILKEPSAWSEELVSYLFGWMSLYGACLVTGQRSHMNIPVLEERVSPGFRKGLQILGEATAFLFSAGILVYGGIRITDLAMAQMTSALGVPVGVFYMALPISGVLNMVYTLMNIRDVLLKGEEQGAI